MESSGSERGLQAAGRARAPRLATLCLFAGLAVAHTWPLATDVSGWSRFDNADAELNAWALTWVSRTIVRDPRHLFDANIFHPERDTLAYSEHLVFQGLLVAPLVWFGATPLVASNVALLLGFALTGWATCLVLSRWTGSVAAGVLGGCLVAFNTHLLTRLPHLQALHVEFLPVAWWALDATLTGGRARHAVALAAAFTLQSLCSGYLLVMSAVSLVAGALVRPGEWLWPSRDARRRLALLLGAAALSVLCLLPFLLPYARVRAAQGLVRSLDEVALYSAEPADYLTTVSRLHYATWSRVFYTPGTDALFPGALALALAAGAMLSGLAWRERRARLLLSATLAGFALSFGPALPGYGALHHALPLFQGVRGAARFGYLAMMGVAGLAAFGLARMLALVGGAGDMTRAGPVRARAAALAGVLAIVIVNAEAWTAPLSFTRFGGLSPVYRALAGEPRAVVAEFPFPSADRVARNSRYVLAAAYHLKPLINGYSGFVPPSYVRNAAALQGFPDAASIAHLRELGVTHVVVHADGYRDWERVRAWLARNLTPLAVSPDAILYRLGAPDSPAR